MIYLVRLAARLVGRPAARVPAQLSLPFDAPRLSVVKAAPPSVHNVMHSGRTGLHRRGFWIRQDPHDCRRTAIGGSFAEVCAALDRLAAQETCSPH